MAMTILIVGRFFSIQRESWIRKTMRFRFFEEKLHRERILMGAVYEFDKKYKPISFKLY